MGWRISAEVFTFDISLAALIVLIKSYLVRMNIILFITINFNFVEKVEAWTYNSRWMKRQKVLMETKVLNGDYNRQTDRSDQKNGFEGSESLCENETAREENIRERMKVE